MEVNFHYNKDGFESSVNMTKMTHAYEVQINMKVASKQNPQRIKLLVDSLNSEAITEALQLMQTKEEFERMIYSCNSNKQDKAIKISSHEDGTFQLGILHTENDTFQLEHDHLSFILVSLDSCLKFHQLYTEANRKGLVLH